MTSIRKSATDEATGLALSSSTRSEAPPPSAARSASTSEMLLCCSSACERAGSDAASGAEVSRLCPRRNVARVDGSSGGAARKLRERSREASGSFATAEASAMRLRPAESEARWASDWMPSSERRQLFSSPSDSSCACCSIPRRLEMQFEPISAWRSPDPPRGRKSSAACSRLHRALRVERRGSAESACVGGGDEQRSGCLFARSSR